MGRLCGKDDVTGDKSSKVLFRMPLNSLEVTVGNEAGRESKEARTAIKADAETQRRSRKGWFQDRSRMESQHRSYSRGRSESFP